MSLSEMIQDERNDLQDRLEIAGKAVHDLTTLAQVNLQEQTRKNEPLCIQFWEGALWALRQVKP